MLQVMQRRQIKVRNRHETIVSAPNVMDRAALTREDAPHSFNTNQAGLPRRATLLRERAPAL